MDTGLKHKDHSSSYPPLQAYSKSLLQYRGETKLPSWDLSPHQLFFRSYAQVGSCPCLL